MPELPEVETIRRALQLHLHGRVVEGLRGEPVRLRRPLEVGRLRDNLVGVRFATPRRRGKFLLLDTEPGGTLLVHLGMSGRLLLVRGRSAPVPPHTHLALELDNGAELRFVDPRRFGLAQWLGPGEERSDPSLAGLGVEPLDPELPAVLPHLLAGRRAPVKALLLDQRLVAGVGNIYATEALWRAGIRPDRPGGRISQARLGRLAVELRRVLLEAIEAGGTTLRDYVTPEGELGMFGLRLGVYGRDGDPCPACDSPLRRSVIAGRSTFWCFRCQR